MTNFKYSILVALFTFVAGSFQLLSPSLLEAQQESAPEEKPLDIELPEVPDAKLKKIRRILSVRHESYSRDNLVKVAGSEAALIASLLKLRTQEGLPYVPYRAVKLLLGYSQYAVVKEAIESDFKSPERRGVAQVVAVHIDKMNDPATRRYIAKMALDEAETDQTFLPYAKALVDSSDAEIRKIARESLR